MLSDTETPGTPQGSRRRSAGAWAASGGTLVALALFFAPAFGPDGFVHRDTGRLHAPVKRWMAEELRRGRFPQWNPYEGLGYPVVANAVDAPQHPFQALVVLWPDVGLKAWILLCFALAATGAIAWARALGLRPGAAAVAGLAFALSGPLVSASDNVQYLTPYATLPWVLAALHAWLTGGRARALAGVAGAGALCAAGGDPQSFGLVVAAFVPYALIVAPDARARAVRRAAGAMALTALASAPFLLPVALWLPLTARAAGLDAADLQRWNLHPVRLSELLLPGIFRGDPGEVLPPLFRAYAAGGLRDVPWFASVYLGASVLGLAALGVAADRRVRWLALAAALALWAALGPAAGFEAVAARVPVLGAFRYWEKMAIWPALLAALAAAAGSEALLARGAGRAVRGYGAAAATLATVAGLALIWPAAVPGAGAGAELHLALARSVAAAALHAGVVLALLAAVAAVGARSRFVRLAPLALATVVGADLFGGNGAAYVLGPDPVAAPPLAAALKPGERVLVPFLLREDRWPERGRLASTWEWGRRTFATAWNVPLRIGTPRIYSGLHEARWSRLVDAQPLARTANLGLFGFGHLLVPGDLRNAARAGVPAPVVEAADAELPAWVVAVPHRPRAYVAEGLRVCAPEDDFQVAVAGGEGERGAVLETPSPQGVQASTGSAQILEDAPGDVRVEVRAPSPALLVVNEAWAPGWSATVDGRPAPVLRANWVAQAVPLQAGAHAVRLRYRTPGLVEGWAAAGAGALVFAVWAARRRRRAASAGAARAV